MNVIKRDGRNVEFDKSKIVNAVLAAFKEVDGEIDSAARNKANSIARDVQMRIENDRKNYTVEDVQDLVEEGLMQSKRKDVAKAYILYRDERTKQRERGENIIKNVSQLLTGSNDYWNNENSNKNPRLSSTQRDYIAGIVSTEMARKYMMPDDIVWAHDHGLIHWHDCDYSIQSEHNCDLVNLEDMLQNGTVISETLIEKPHSFSTACNIATQIIAQVASSQYGGQSISLEHLAPFVDISRQNIRKYLKEELGDVVISDGQFNEIVEKRLSREITKGIQTLQYQVITLMTTNGQAPFLSVFMYLNEAKSEQEKHDLALLIEEVLKQRYDGVKNEQGVPITPAFPKLLYVLEEDNIKEGSEYWYLTQLAAKCSAKRLVPDYLSEKVMKELKDGNCFPVMG